MRKEMQRVCVGCKFKLSNIKTGVDSLGVQKWQTSIALKTLHDGKMEIFDYCNLWISGQCEFEIGDWIEITKISGISFLPTYNESGGRVVYKTIYCEVKKAIYEKDYKGAKYEK